MLKGHQAPVVSVVGATVVYGGARRWGGNDDGWCGVVVLFVRSINSVTNIEKQRM